MVSGVILVTGGAGFIGSHVVDALVAEGRQVRVIDLLLPKAHDAEPEYLNPDAEYIFGDIGNGELLDRALVGVGAVCHQASMVGLGTAISDISDYVRHNDLGTAELLLAMHRNGFAGRIVLGSSMVVYGEGRFVCSEHGVVRPLPRPEERLRAGAFEPECPRCGRDLEASPVPEDAPADPRNTYAATKLHQEHLCAVFARETGCAFVALRYHNVYGERMPRDTPYAGVASIFRSALEAGNAPKVFEDGRQMRDFVEVRDIAQANLLALDPGSPSGAFNIASGDPHSVGEMAAALASAHGGGLEPVVTGDYRLGDVRHVFASIERAKSELGYAPSVGFREGMESFASAELRARS